jgi:hypothetical protein
MSRRRLGGDGRNLPAVWENLWEMDAVMSGDNGTVAVVRGLTPVRPVLTPADAAAPGLRHDTRQASRSAHWPIMLSREGQGKSGAECNRPT